MSARPAARRGDGRSRSAARSRTGRWAASGSRPTTASKTYEELVAKGVEFVQPPADRPYGVEAVMRDNSGNWLVLVEPREFTPEDFGTDWTEP